MKKFQPTLKLGFALAIACAAMFTLPVGPPVQGKTGNKSAAVAPAAVSVVLDIGRRRNCPPNTDCCAGFGICKVTITVRSARAVKGELSTASDGKLTLVLLEKAPDEGQTLFLDEDIVIPAEIAAKLGLKSATLLKGKYTFSASRALLNARLLR
jgi:hypothetical protein